MGKSNMLTRRDWLRAASVATLSLAFAITVAGTTTAQDVQTQTIFINNLHCQGCAKRLRNELFKVAGVKDVKTDVKAGTAVITPTEGSSPDARAVWEAAEKEKFEVAKLVTPNGTYDEKP